jgi:hypothetical protein
MVFDILAVMLLVGAFCYVRAMSNAARGVAELPADDQPPPAADEALPHGRRLTLYVRGGLEEIDDWLRRNEEAA